MKYSLLSVLFLTASVFAAGKEVIVKEKLIESFEKFIPPAQNKLGSLTPTRFPGWGLSGNVEVAPSTKHVTLGKKSAKLTIHADKRLFPLFKLVLKAPQNWSEYNAIAFDITNPIDDVNKLRGEIQTIGGGGSFPIHMPAQSSVTAIGYFNRTNKKINPSKVYSFTFYIHHTNINREYFIDNIRLVKIKHVKTPRPRLPKGALSLQGGPAGLKLPNDLKLFSPEVNSDKNFKIQTNGIVKAFKSKIPDYTGAMGSIIYSDKKATLIFKNLAAGKYGVYIAAGNIVPGKILDYTVTCGDNSVRLVPSTKFQTDSVILETESRNGEISLELSPVKGRNWAIGSLVVYPLKDRAKVECRYIATLEKDYFMGSEKERGSKNLQREVKEFKNLSLNPIALEKQRGLVLFSRNVNRPQFFETIPLSKEILNASNPRALRTEVTKDETSQVTLSLHALSDLGLVRAEISAFRNDAGGTIAAENLKLGVVRPFYASLGSFYQILPSYICPRPQIIVSKGESRRFWLSVKNPGNIAPGIYHGRITLSVLDKKVSVPVEFNMLPVQLLQDPRINYGFFVYQGKPGSKAWAQALWEMRDHGVTSMAPTNLISYRFNSARKRFELASQRYLDRFMKAYKAAGLSGPLINYSPNQIYGMAATWLGDKCGTLAYFSKDYDLKKLPPEFFKAVAGLEKELQDYCKAKGYPQIATVFLDENPSPTTVKRVYQPIKDAGCITTTTSIGRYGIRQSTDSCIDINIGTLGLENLKRYIVQLHHKGKQYWINGPMSGAKNTPYQYRYYLGFKSWLFGINGFVPWNFSRTTLRASTGIENKTGDWWFSLYTPQGQINAIAFEMYRAGVYDRRAVYTLEQLVKKYGGSSDAAVKKLVKSGRMVLAGLKRQLSPLGDDNAKWRAWTIRNADKTRKKIVKLIVSFKEKGLTV